eukprot:scaffold219734_cov32-Tisochrysis_lutea.AAC.2
MGHIWVSRWGAARVPCEPAHRQPQRVGKGRKGYDGSGLRAETLSNCKESTRIPLWTMGLGDHDTSLISAIPSRLHHETRMLNTMLLVWRDPGAPNEQSSVLGEGKADEQRDENDC